MKSKKLHIHQSWCPLELLMLGPFLSSYLNALISAYIEIVQAVQYDQMTTLVMAELYLFASSLPQAIPTMTPQLMSQLEKKSNKTHKQMSIHVFINE